MERHTPEWLSHQIVEHTQEAIIFADRNGIIQLWNAGAATLFGYSAAEVIGEPIDVIIPERLQDRHGEGYRHVMATGDTQYSQKLLAVPAMRKDGTRISIEFTVVLVREPTGDILGVAAIIRDVTARWQREKDMQTRLAALENNASTPGDEARSLMEQRQIAQAVQAACIEAAILAYEDAGLSGLCHEGRWECAVDAMRGVDLRSLIAALTAGAPDEGAPDVQRS
jgi:PAS domain S-box-containing protein